MLTTIPFFHRFIHKKKLIPDSFNKELVNAVKMITYNEKNVTFVGSFIMKGQSYSSDIDVFEELGDNGAEALQSIVRKLQNSQNYILDIKAGYDLTFQGHADLFSLIYSLGKIQDHHIRLFDHINIQYHIECCYDENLINKDQYLELSQLNHQVNHSTGDLKAKAWFDLREAIRKLITLRWTPEEVLQGYKQGKKCIIRLSDAVNTFITKIDVAFIYQGYYTEISNVLITKGAKEHGLVFMPISSHPEDWREGIKYNLTDFYVHGQYLKTLKRTFSLALLDNNKSLQEQIAPILVSDVSRLNKAANILSTHLTMLQMPHPPIKEIKTQINNLKPFIANIYQFSFGEKGVDSLIDKIGRSKQKTMIKLVEELIENLKKVINRQTLHYMTQNEIEIPEKYML